MDIANAALEWFGSWFTPAATASGATWEALAWIGLGGLIAGVVVDATQMIARTRRARQALILNLFMAAVFQVAFGTPQVYHADGVHYPRRFIAFGLLAIYFSMLAVGIALTRVIRRRHAARTGTPTWPRQP